MARLLGIGRVIRWQLEDGGENIEDFIQPRVFSGGEATGIVIAIEDE